MKIDEKKYNFIKEFNELLEKHKNKVFSNRLIRIKANVLPKQTNYPENYHNYAHIDNLDHPVETLLYYVNDSDGGTFIFNEKKGDKFDKLTIKERVTPKKGRAVLFDSNYFHASSSPVKSSSRAVINFVFQKE